MSRAGSVLQQQAPVRPESESPYPGGTYLACDDTAGDAASVGASVNVLDYGPAELEPCEGTRRSIEPVSFAERGGAFCGAVLKGDVEGSHHFFPRGVL